MISSKRMSFTLKVHWGGIREEIVTLIITIVLIISLKIINPLRWDSVL